MLKKASKKIKQTKKLIKISKVIYFAAILTALSFVIFFQIKFIELKKLIESNAAKDEIIKTLNQVSCKSPVWTINTIFSLINVCIFKVFVHKIDDMTTQQIKREKLVFGFPEFHFAEQRKKLKNLW